VRLVAAELKKLFTGAYEKTDVQLLKPLSGDALKYVLLRPEIGDVPLPFAA
jgi:hypothetical protein